MHEYPLSLCTVMLLELLVPAGEPPESPAVLKKVVHELVAKALRGLPENTRMAVETAGAAVVCFTGDPEEALHSALLLRDLVSQRYGGLISMRVALHMGPVRVTANNNDQVTVTGDGIDRASRVKARGGPNEVVVSSVYHDLLSRLNPDTEELFQYHGPTADHPLEVYTVVAPLALPHRDTLAPFVVTRPSQLGPGSSLDSEAVQDIEAELAGYIGPLARVLVRKMQGRAASPQALRELLAPAIQSARTRDFFLAGKLGGLPLSGAPDSAHAWVPAAPAQSGSRPARGSDSTRQLDIAPAELVIIEHTLQRFLGSMAQPLMLRQIDVCAQFRDFIAAIADAIAHPEQRAVFLQALQRALPERRI
ncbi:MAG: hypothetical protein JWQ33_1862 [Ramlibacter sp.]|nr:hypothetical protein [Ramlibacter sp.]